MPIDITRLLSAEPLQWEASWTPQDVILYHLGLGAGTPPTDPGELALAYERDLVVLPSFATIPGFMPIPRYADVPGLDVNLAMLVHGEHDVVIHRPLPTEATATSTMRPVAVYDKRSGAQVIFETTTVVDDDPVATNTMTAFVRGEGEFVGSKGGSAPPGRQSGGDAGPTGERVRPPKRDPDLVVTTPTLPQQALLYRLSGDANPLHADPEFAAAGGFDRPILHGLCTYGMACKAAVQGLLGGDVTAVDSYQARFSGVVFPGDVLTHHLWRGDDGIIVETRVEDRLVLKQAKLTLA